jgi:hypothetical protein
MNRHISFALLALAVSTAALAAEKPARRAQPARNPCASEGAGFVYSRETSTCIRVGGAVGAEISGGSTGQGYRW